MPTAVSPILPQIDGREERLQRVETSLGAVAVQMATIGTKQDHLVETLEKGFTTLQKSQEAFLERLEALGEKLDKHEDRIEDLEREDRELREKRNKIKTVFVSIIAIGGGVFVTKIAELLWGKL